MDTNEIGHFPWDAADWVEEITAWIGARLAERNESLSGPVEVVHKRTWSAFATAPSTIGTVFFKTTSPYLRHEIGLTRLLAGWTPDVIPPIIGSDAEKGWLLTEDRGISLRTLDRTIGQMDHWTKIMPLYADLQQKVTPNLDAMLAVGVPDHRLGRLPGLYRDVLDNDSALRTGREGGLLPEQLDGLRALLPTVDALCVELAGFGIPETIAHEEVHENNVLADGDRYTFIDWSDCSVSHPFMTLLVTIRAAAHWLKLEEQGPEMNKLRDTYLDCWTRYGDIEKLRRAAGIAYRLGMICRSLSYLRGLGPLPEKYRIENDSIHGWLQDFLEAQTEADK